MIFTRGGWLIDDDVKVLAQMKSLQHVNVPAMKDETIARLTAIPRLTESGLNSYYGTGKNLSALAPLVDAAALAAEARDAKADERKERRRKLRAHLAEAAARLRHRGDVAETDAEENDGPGAP